MNKIELHDLLPISSDISGKDWLNSSDSIVKNSGKSVDTNFYKQNIRMMLWYTRFKAMINDIQYGPTAVPIAIIEIMGKISAMGLLLVVNEEKESVLTSDDLDKIVSKINESNEIKSNQTNNELLTSISEYIKVNKDDPDNLKTVSSTPNQKNIIINLFTDSNKNNSGDLIDTGGSTDAVYLPTSDTGATVTEGTVTEGTDTVAADTVAAATGIQKSEEVKSEGFGDNIPGIGHFKKSLAAISVATGIPALGIVGVIGVGLIGATIYAGIKAKAKSIKEMNRITDVGVNTLSDLLVIIEKCIKHEISVVYETNKVLMSGNLDNFFINCNESILLLRKKYVKQWEQFKLENLINLKQEPLEIVINTSYLPENALAVYNSKNDIKQAIQEMVSSSPGVKNMCASVSDIINLLNNYKEKSEGNYKEAFLKLFNTDNYIEIRDKKVVFIGVDIIGKVTGQIIKSMLLPIPVDENNFNLLYKNSKGENLKSTLSTASTASTVSDVFPEPDSPRQQAPRQQAARPLSQKFLTTGWGGGGPKPEMIKLDNIVVNIKTGNTFYTDRLKNKLKKEWFKQEKEYDSSHKLSRHAASNSIRFMWILAKNKNSFDNIIKDINNDEHLNISNKEDIKNQLDYLRKGLDNKSFKQIYESLTTNQALFFRSISVKEINEIFTQLKELHRDAIIKKTSGVKDNTNITVLLAFILAYCIMKIPPYINITINTEKEYVKDYLNGKKTILNEPNQKLSDLLARITSDIMKYLQENNKEKELLLDIINHYIVSIATEGPPDHDMLKTIYFNEVIDLIKGGIVAPEQIEGLRTKWTPLTNPDKTDPTYIAHQKKLEQKSLDLFNKMITRIDSKISQKGGGRHSTAQLQLFKYMYQLQKPNLTNELEFIQVGDRPILYSINTLVDQITDMIRFYFSKYEKLPGDKDENTKYRDKFSGEIVSIIEYKDFRGEKINFSLDSPIYFPEHGRAKEQVSENIINIDGNPVTVKTLITPINNNSGPFDSNQLAELIKKRIIKGNTLIYPSKGNCDTGDAGINTVNADKLLPDYVFTQNLDITYVKELIDENVIKKICGYCKTKRCVGPSSIPQKAASVMVIVDNQDMHEKELYDKIVSYKNISNPQEKDLLKKIIQDNINDIAIKIGGKQGQAQQSFGEQLERRDIDEELGISKINDGYVQTSDKLIKQIKELNNSSSAILEAKFNFHELYDNIDEDDDSNQLDNKIKNWIDFYTGSEDFYTELYTVSHDNKLIIIAQYGLNIDKSHTVLRKIQVKDIDIKEYEISPTAQGWKDFKSKEIKDSKKESDVLIAVKHQGILITNLIFGKLNKNFISSNDIWNIINNLNNQDILYEGGKFSKLNNDDKPLEKIVNLKKSLHQLINSNYMRKEAHAYLVRKGGDSQIFLKDRSRALKLSDHYTQIGVFSKDVNKEIDAETKRRLESGGKDSVLNTKIGISIKITTDKKDQRDKAEMNFIVPLSVVSSGFYKTQLLSKDEQLLKETFLNSLKKVILNFVTKFNKNNSQLLKDINVIKGGYKKTYYTKRKKNTRRKYTRKKNTRKKNTRKKNTRKKYTKKKNIRKKNIRKRRNTKKKYNKKR